MSLYEVQQCLFDYLRVLEDPRTQGRPEISTDGYDLTDTERDALVNKDVGAIYAMGTHPVIINGYCRALGYKKADYRPLLEAAAPKTEKEERQMADIVMAYSASHAPMMSADKESAPPDQAERFFGGLAKVRQQAADTRPQAIVFMTGEHFTNFFLQNLPQIAIGLGSGHQGPLEKWLKIPKTIIPGDPGLAEHVLEDLVADGFYPALSHKMKLDHGFMTVYHELDPEMKLPVVPIVLNCTTPPLMTLRQSYEFGKSVGAAIRSYDGLERVGLVGAGGLSHFVGEPRIGDIEEDFDRWFLKELERQPLSDDLLDMPNDELMEAGNGTGEVRAWVAVGGAMEGHPATTLSYEPIYEWINGMGVISYQA